MTEYTLRVTIICPEAMMDDACNLAAVLGQSAADLRTFQTASWQDSAGNLYSVASTLARPSFVTAAASTLERPAWDGDDPAEYAVNMAGAERAQAALVIYDPEAPVQADPTHLLAIVHPVAHEALTMAGVERVPIEPF